MSNDASRSETVRPKLAPYITVKGAAEAIDYYIDAFGAVELFRLEDPQDGRIGHAQLALGETILMISDEFPDFGAHGPETLGGSPVKMHIEVDDVDAVFKRAIEKGGIEMRPVKQQFHGSRGGMLADPFGHQWFVETVTEVLTPDEMQRRWNEMVSA